MTVGNSSTEEIIPRFLTAEECTSAYKYKHPKDELYCNAIFDDFYCWPPTPAGQVVSRTCAEIFETLHLRVNAESNGAKAYRVCEEDASWLRGNWTNYTACVVLIREDSIAAPLAVSYILFICSVLSLIALIITLFIFCYFKSLHCQRLKVHRNLVVALIIHSILLILISTPVVTGDDVAPHIYIGWLCKTILSLKMYASMASINWMFVEGLLLHSRITVSIFQQKAPFKIYYLIGWGLPSVFILTWCLLMSRDLNSSCWKGYGDSIFVWILNGPMLIALSVNTFFLVNIIRILVTKLRASASAETAQVRKAIKATALLFPLLGVTHLLFAINPGDELETTYMITNAVFQSSQGLFLAILYCFTNSEVQAAIRNAYVRSRIQSSKRQSSSSSRATSNINSEAIAEVSKKCMLPLYDCQETENSLTNEDNNRDKPDHNRPFLG